jgi:hypothetical protein
MTHQQTGDHTFNCIAVSTLVAAGTAIGLMLFTLTSLLGYIASSGMPGLQLFN